MAKQAISKGVSPWTGTFFGNLWLGLIWGAIAVYRGEIVPSEAWIDAGIIGLLFVLGQMFTYLAYQFGDVSVATPVFGTKVLIVAILASLLGGQPITAIVWLAGVLACAGVILIQWSGRTATDGDTEETTPSRIGLTIFIALTAALSLSLFDVFLGKWATGRWNSLAFLPVMFGSAAALSVVFLPWVDKFGRLKELNATWWMLGGTFLMASQAMSMCYTLSTYGDVARTNIVYSLRGMWGVIFAWLLARALKSGEANASRATMMRRLIGAGLLTAAVVLAISAGEK